MNGTVRRDGPEGRRQRYIMLSVPDPSKFSGKPFPCPVCNTELRLKISCKGKPYCTCLECGIQIFFRGQEGIARLYKIIESEEAVVLEFSAPARALFLYKRLQGLKRQKKHLEDKQGFFNHDRDRDEVIEVLGEEIKRVRKTLQEAKKDGGKQK
jgi:hypothetical protein